jgi:hypothetical protein
VLPSAGSAANTAEVKRTLERKLSARDNVTELQSRGIYRPEGILHTLYHARTLLSYRLHSIIVVMISTHCSVIHVRYHILSLLLAVDP